MTTPGPGGRDRPETSLTRSPHHQIGAPPRMSDSIKHKTAAIQKSIETGDRHPLHHFDSRAYIQHNLAIGDGFGSLLAFLDQLPSGTSRVDPLRTFEDGDISFAHLEYFLAPMGAVVGFEVHRWRDGRIVEHWDNLQSVADRPNPSGRTMVDGPTEGTDHDRTAANKRRVELFVRDVLVGASTDNLADHFDGDRYVQHNPNVGDGVGEFARALASAASEGTGYDQLHRVLGDGSFCLAISEGRVRGRHNAFYDLFRLENDKIAEHWDVVQEIPPRDQWQNDNGKF